MSNLQPHIAAVRDALEYIVNSEDYAFTECSRAEEIWRRSKQALESLSAIEAAVTGNSKLREIDRRLCDVVHFIRGTEDRKPGTRNPILEEMPEAVISEAAHAGGKKE